MECQLSSKQAISSIFLYSVIFWQNLVSICSNIILKKIISPIFEIYQILEPSLANNYFLETLDSMHIELVIGSLQCLHLLGQVT